MFFENPTLNAISQGAALGGALGASVGTQPALITVNDTSISAEETSHRHTIQLYPFT